MPKKIVIPKAVEQEMKNLISESVALAIDAKVASAIRDLVKQIPVRTPEQLDQIKDVALIHSANLRQRTAMMPMLGDYAERSHGSAIKGDDHGLVQAALETARLYREIVDREDKIMKRIERLPAIGPDDAEKTIDKKIKNNETLLELAKALSFSRKDKLAHIDLIRRSMNDIEMVIHNNNQLAQTARANEDRIKIAQIKKGHGKPGNALELTAQMNQNADNKAAAFSEARTVEQAPEPTPAQVVETQIETAPLPAPLASRPDPHAPHGPIQWPKPRILP